MRTANAEAVIDEYHAVIEVTAKRDAASPMSTFHQPAHTLPERSSRCATPTETFLCQLLSGRGIRAQAEYGASTEAGRVASVSPRCLTSGRRILFARDGVRELTSRRPLAALPRPHSVGK